MSLSHITHSRVAFAPNHFTYLLTIKFPSYPHLWNKSPLLFLIHSLCNIRAGQAFLWSIPFILFTLLWIDCFA